MAIYVRQMASRGSACGLPSLQAILMDSEVDILVELVPFLQEQGLAGFVP